MVLNCNSSKSGNATTVSEDQANAITFKASLKDAIGKAIEEVEKKRNDIAGVKDFARAGAIVGGIIGGVILAGGVVLGGLMFASAASTLGLAFSAAIVSSAVMGPIGIAVGAALIVGLLVTGIFAGIGAVVGAVINNRRLVGEYDSQIARLRSLSDNIDNLSAEACAEAIGKLASMDGAGSEKEKDALAVQAFEVLEKEIGGFGIEKEDRAKIMRETWESYKAELAKQSKTNVS